MKPRTLTIDGTAYTCTAPTGRDWLEVSELKDAARAMEIVARCVQVDGRKAFVDGADVESQPMALILALDEQLGAMCAYPSDP